MGIAEKIGGLIDEAISIVSPSFALRRAQNRFAYQSVRSFEGATQGRRGKGFGRASNDPNTDLLSLPTLKARCRWMYANNPYARKAIKSVVLNCVGTGIRPAFKSATKRNADRAKKSWQEWAETPACDFYGRLNIYGLQALAMRTIAMSGEVLVIRKRVKEQGMPSIKLQILDGDFLDTSKNSMVINGSDSYIVQGVEHDAQGRRIAYWIYDKAPSNANDLRISSTRIDASEVLHIFEEERPGQVRGIPFLASTMLRMNDLDGYEDAQLMRQKVAACFSAFVTQPTDPMTLNKTNTDALERVEPGIIERLNPGEEVTFASPPGAEGYADYVRKQLQGAASGVGITYEQMTGDLSNVNFSSGRMGLIEAHKQFEDWQHNMFVPLFCNAVLNWLNDAWIVMGAITAPVSAEWTPPGRNMIDPVKETKAYSDQMAAGIMSWEEVVREQGYDPDVLFDQMKANAQKLKDIGIPFGWLYGPNATVVPPQDNNDD